MAPELPKEYLLPCHDEYKYIDISDTHGTPSGFQPHTDNLSGYDSISQTDHYEAPFWPILQSLLGENKKDPGNPTRWGAPPLRDDVSYISSRSGSSGTSAGNTTRKALSTRRGSSPEPLNRDTILRGPQKLIELLETIAGVLRGGPGPSGGNYLLLQEHLTIPFMESCWPRIRDLALELPTLFPSRTLPVLGTDGSPSTLSLTKRQTACLLAHQFLGTLRPPSWRAGECVGFSIWYSVGQPHPMARKMYLDGLIKYLKEHCDGYAPQPSGPGDEDEDEDSEDSDHTPWFRPHTPWFRPQSPAPARPNNRPHRPQQAFLNHNITYTLYTAGPDFTTPWGTASSHTPLTRYPLLVDYVNTFDTTPNRLGVPSGAAVVSTNSRGTPVFGQGVTPEEITVGGSPDACPAVLVTPPLSDSQALVITGPEAMLNNMWKGQEVRSGAHNRFLYLVEDNGMERRYAADWAKRVMLFIDGPEIGPPETQADSLADLSPENIESQLKKAIVAFGPGDYADVTLPLSFCAAGDADPYVRTVLMWSAATAVGKRLRILCDPDTAVIGDGVREIRDKMKAKGMSAKDAVDLIESMPRKIKKLDTYVWLKLALDGEPKNGKDPRFD